MIGSTSRASDFIGRRQELAVLSAALEDALSGRGQMVMLTGDPGIGKTRLVQELASNAQSFGAQVLWGWCYEHAGAPPYWPYVQPIRNHIETVDARRLTSQLASGGAAIAEIVPELREKLPELGPLSAAEPEQARFRLFDSVATFFKNVSQEQALLFVIDDLHWADDSSLLLLEFLAREITASPVMIVGTYRDVEVTGDHLLNRILGNLARENHFQRMQLGGLSQQETGELVEAGSGVTVTEDAVSTLYRRTEGNPLFVGEVVAAVGLQVITRDSNWTASIPTAIREATVRRLSQLSEPCKRLLRTASVVGRDFNIQLLRDLNTDIPEDEFLEGLDEALGIGVVESFPARPGRYQFCHALIEQAVYEEISPIGKARAHAAVGEALERLHHDNLDERAGELAYHFAEAVAVSGTEKTVRYSLIAGEKALDSFAYDQALIHFGRVLEAKEGQADDAESADALFGLGRAQSATLPRHEMKEAQVNLNRAFDYYASMGDTVRIVAIAEFPFPVWSQHQVQGARLLRRALDLVPDDSLEAGRLHSYLGNIQGMVDGDYPSARESFDSALAIARREGDSALEMRTLNFAAQVELWHHQIEESLKSSLLAVDLAVAASDPRGEVSGRYWANLTSRALGHSQEFQRQASAILKPAERLGDRHWLATAHHTVAWTFVLRGEWNEAREANQRSVELEPLDPRVLMQRVILESQCGNRSEAEVYLERLESVVLGYEAGPTTANSCLAFTSPLARTILGSVRRPEVGEAAIAGVLSSPAATPFFSTWARIGASLLAVLNDDTESAGELYTALKPLAGIAAVNFNLDRALGLLAGCLGDLDSAVGHFKNADGFYRRAGFRPELAWTCLDHSAALTRRDAPGDRDTAVTILDEARSIATELGMTPLVDKAAELQERSVSKPATGPAYPSGLTQREVEVLSLIAHGKTNREIAIELVLSERTVQRHISNIYSKIQVRNRAEATTFALRHLTS
ncbi:MAG: AAA family ATPase [Chloroflexi bacterium]|nr:AAA family ATPase [Chloroflexota bacterium]